MRTVFTAYLLFIAVGLVVYILLPVATQ